MNIKMILSDDTMFGFEKNKSVVVKTDSKGFQIKY